MKEEKGQLPRHVAFIMDGNGRWAAKRGLPRGEGHRAGSKAMQRIAEDCGKRGIEYVTFYAFSTENWKRPKDEVDTLLSLLRQYLADVEKKTPDNVKMCVFGEITMLDDDIKRRINVIRNKTAHNTGITVNIAFNYGGRGELVHAMRALAERCQSGELSPADITEQTIEDHLYTAGQPDPDVIVRPSGELRLSNFFLWQAAYAELVFLDVLWPDFDVKDMDLVLEQYRQRDRRFGGR